MPEKHLQHPHYLEIAWEEQARLFVHHLEQIRQRPDRPSVHDIRVALKKMRSLLQLVNTLGPGGDEKLRFAQLKIFFATAGRMRDVDMNLVLLRNICREENTHLPSCQSALRSLLRITRGNTRTQAAAPLETEIHTLTQWFRQRISTWPAENCIRSTHEQVLQELDLLRTAMDNIAKDTHDTRKRLKQVYYWLRFTPVNTCFDEKQMKQLDKAHVALGHWQDHTVFRARLRYFRRGYLVKGTAEYEQARKLEEATQLIREQWLARAGELLKKLLG